LTAFLTSLISLRATATCFLTWRSGLDHSVSAVIRCWWKVSKCGWAHGQQTSLTQAYKNLFPDMTSASIPAVTTRSCISCISDCIYCVGTMQNSLYDENIKRNSPCMIKNIYFSNFESCLRYGIIIWGGDNESNKIFKLQKKVLRIISGVSNHVMETNI
jgi:hypothetical protein